MKTYALAANRKVSSNRILYIGNSMVVRNSFVNSVWMLNYPPFNKVKKLKVLKVL